MRLFDVVVVGAGPAGIGITAMLQELGIEQMIVLEREEVGASFEKWPKCKRRSKIAEKSGRFKSAVYPPDT